MMIRNSGRLDHSILRRSDPSGCPGLLETFICAGGRAPFWAEHWARLVRSARRLGIILPARMKPILESQIGELGPHPHRGRITLYPNGRYELSIESYDARELMRTHPRSHAVVCSPAPRGYPGPFSGMKTTRRADLDRIFARVRQAGMDDAILFIPERPASKSVVYETTRGNLFWIRNRIVHTPHWKLGCLPGVMRGWVIRQCRQWNIAVREGRNTLADIQDSDAVFRTNALIGVAPIGAIRGLGRWATEHPLIRRLRRAIREKITGGTGAAGGFRRGAPIPDRFPA